MSDVNLIGDVIVSNAQQLGTVSKVDTDDGGYVYEAVGHDVTRFSPEGAAHALAEAMEEQ